MSTSMSKTDFKQLGTSKKIESPLAKYNSAGQLMCVICDQIVKSEMVWNAHLNSKVHLENKNKLKSKLSTPSTSAPSSSSTPESSSSNKNGRDEEPHEFKKPVVPPPSKDKDFLKRLIAQDEDENTQEENGEPSVKAKKQKIDNLVNAAHSIDLNKKQEEEKPSTSNGETMEVSLGTSDLPEGFFDNPELDARARGTTRTQNLDAEYEEFKRAMQAEELKSDLIIEKDDLERDVDRDLVEVDELISRWSRIEELHQRREALKASSSQTGEKTGKSKKSTDVEMSDDEDVDLESVMGLALRAKNIC